MRGVWALVERLGLSAYYEESESRGSNAGRPATDPAVLLALWLFANAEGVGSARLLERLCERDAPYRWICGGVPVNYHTLSDFRVSHGEKLDGLLTQVLAALMTMLEQLEERTGKKPREYLVDGGFVTLENIEVIAERGITGYAPVPQPRDPAVDPHAPKPGDPPAVAAWRKRMGKESAKRIYVQRGVLAERTNADLRVHRRLDRLHGL